MPPRRETTLTEIVQRLTAIEERITRIETGPHVDCPGPVLTQRVTAVEDAIRRHDDALRRIEDKVAANAKERYDQIENLRTETQVNFDRLTNTLRWAAGLTVSVAALLVAALKLLGV